MTERVGFGAFEPSPEPPPEVAPPLGWVLLGAGEVVPFSSDVPPLALSGIVPLVAELVGRFEGSGASLGPEQPGTPTT